MTCGSAGGNVPITGKRKEVTVTEPTRRHWQEERGGRIDPDKTVEPELDADGRVDEAIAESFPASDPPSSNAGIDEDQHDPKP